MEFDPKHRDLIIIKATQIATLLTRVNETYWANAINHAIELLGEDRFQEGTQALKSMFGGMGSINDLVISPLNGHSLAQENIAA